MIQIPYIGPGDPFWVKSKVVITGGGESIYPVIYLGFQTEKPLSNVIHKYHLLV